MEAGRATRQYKGTARPPDVWPEMWRIMSKKQRQIEIDRWTVVQKEKEKEKEPTKSETRGKPPAEREETLAARSALSASKGTKDYWATFPDRLVRVHLIDRTTLFVPQNGDCPLDTALLESKRLTRYTDGKHHWQEIQDDWTGPEAQRTLEFSWIGETIFYRRSTKEVSSSASAGDSDMEQWRETSANSARIPAMPRADAEEE